MKIFNKNIVFEASAECCGQVLTLILCCQLPRDPRKSGNLINVLEVDDPKLIVSFHLMGQLNPVNSVLANPMVSSLDVHFDVSRNLLKTAQELNATEGYIFKNLEKDGM